MRHPFVDESRFKGIVYGICHILDPIINFFNHYYITTEEGFDMFPLRDVHPERTGVNGHIEIYTGEHTMPRYIKIPIVRIVYDNRKWNHDHSDYNRTIAVTIAKRPRALQKHRFRKGELTKEQYCRFLRFVSRNRDDLLKLWYDGWNQHPEIDFCDNDPEHVFDWHLCRWEETEK